MRIPKSRGQATVEYIFVLAIAILLSIEITRRFTTFFQDQMGKVGHVLSTHLTIGICPSKCFYSEGGYVNAYKP